MKQYLDLLTRIKTEGLVKTDRTGTGTKSVFGHQMRFNLSQGFPLLTTKKVFLKGIIHELLWFLNGDTNIKYLVDNGVHIWDNDAYRYYNELCVKNGVLPVSMEEFLRAAQEGVERTKDMIATKGRASYLGERSLGHQDPGATSFTLLFSVIVKNA